MRLSDQDVNLFYKLHPKLLVYTNQQMKLIKGITTVEEIKALPFEDLLRITTTLWDNLSLIDAFVAKNPFDFLQEELDIVLSWKNMMKGEFFLVRYLKKYAVFLEEKSGRAHFKINTMKQSSTSEKQLIFSLIL